MTYLLYGLGSGNSGKATIGLEPLTKNVMLLTVNTNFKQVDGWLFTQADSSRRDPLGPLFLLGAHSGNKEQH